MGGLSKASLCIAGLLALGGCREGRGVADAGVPDAGAPKVVVPRAVPPPPPPAPPPPPLQLAEGDGCQPYWLLVELGCNERAIKQRIPPETRFCDPVHERTTRSSVVGVGRDVSEERMTEFLAGARWNDDPENLLLQKGGASRWCRAIRAGSGSSLTARSHFGDLQFLHGLAQRPGETNQQVYDRMMVWMEFAYRVGAGDIAGTTKLKDVPVEGFAKLFPKQRGDTVAELLHTPPDGDVKARALGTLMHLVQDLLGDAHGAFETSQLTGRRQFGNHYAYARGTLPGHRDTGWREAWAEGAPLSTWPQAEYAAQRGLDLIRLASRGRDWETAQQYLVDVLLNYGSYETKSVAWKGRQ